MDRLYGDYEYTWEDTGRTRGMDFVQKYLRMKHVIVFKMSHDVLQVRFPPFSSSSLLLFDCDDGMLTRVGSSTSTTTPK